ncbi:NAD(P)-dependent oxidoreductase [Larkinella humicola]|uniref:NAD(P)-dependent oxidoreductase n=1 Tax=Larkinella humicola TaxID=2607654 RepID=A0A5N1JF44_9BACT|nr:NAD(P)-dependent oxidoreductase [Larkinella humicola]KAA9349260.1 NAD(P)-dependent oxidoreductase [Larkinella humicola]
MKIALIGATGFVGSALLKEALHRGYAVTAIVRHPEKMTVENPQLTVVKGDVLNEAEVAGLVGGHDAVVSAYNAGWQNPNLYNEYLAGSLAIQNSTKKAGVKRLLVVGGAGSLEIAPGVQLIDTPQFPAEWKPGALAARDYLNTLKKEEDLDWTFICPAILLEPGERTGQFRLGTNQPVFDENGVSKISVEDLAVAIFDELDEPAHVHQRFTAAY